MSIFFIYLFFSLIPTLVAPEKPVLTKPSSQAISVGETTSSEVCMCMCVCVLNCNDAYSQPCIFCRCLSDRYMRVDERTSPAENYLVQR